MIPRNAEAVSHDTPYKRIEIGSSRAADKRREITGAMSGVGPTERDRIWNLVVQTARGVNQQPRSDQAADAVGGGLSLPVEIALDVESWSWVFIARELQPAEENCA